MLAVVGRGRAASRPTNGTRPRRSLRPRIPLGTGFAGVFSDLVEGRTVVDRLSSQARRPCATALLSLESVRRVAKDKADLSRSGG